MTRSARVTWFRRLARLGAVVALCVVVLGAWVRLNGAGLGCPDWPGCYGHVSAGAAAEQLSAAQARFPDRAFEYQKAAKEMLHRYVAGSLLLIILALAAIALWNRRDPEQPRVLPWVLLLVVIGQAMLGMWTVTELLTPLIVVLHLLGGLTSLSLLTWLSIPPKTHRGGKIDNAARFWGMVSLALLAVQLFLGGWTSANYAAVSCPDFPTCQSSYWPHMDINNAFVLWRGSGINYEGGVLEHPARVAIHFVHRLGAVCTALIVGLALFTAWRSKEQGARRATVLVGLALAGQLLIGPLMVVMRFPLWLATAHNAMAALLLVSLIYLNRTLWTHRPGLLG